MGGCCETERSKVPTETKAEATSRDPANEPIPQAKAPLAKTKLTLAVEKQTQLTLPFTRDTPNSTTTPANKRSASGLSRPADVLVTGELTTPIHRSNLPLLEQYTLVRKVQSRRLCSIYLMIPKHTEQQVLIKRLETGNRVMREAAKVAAKKEMEVLSKLDHPNVLKVVELYQDGSAFYTVSETLQSGNVLDADGVANMSEWQQAKVLYQLLSALQHCHSKGIFHLNLRLDNVLILSSGPKDVLIKLIGFGSPPPNADSVSKSTLYAAPEVLDRSEVTEKADVWSCGVLLVQLLTGKLLFANASEIMQTSVDYRSATWEKLSMHSCILAKKMLERHATSRPTAAECLQDPWLQTYTSQPNTGKGVHCSLQRMRIFHSLDPLQLAAVNFVSNFVTSVDQVLASIAQFKAMDKDGDGQLSKEELIEAYSKQMESGQATRIVERVMEAVDTNHSGQVDYTEFLTAMADPRVLFTKENLAPVFAALSSGDNSRIRFKDLQARIKGKDEETTSLMWENFCEDNGLSSEKLLRFDDFVKLMQKIGNISQD